MSEVLSGAEVGSESARVALPPRDERQSLRVARFLMAAGTCADKALYEGESAGRNRVVTIG